LLIPYRDFAVLTGSTDPICESEFNVPFITSGSILYATSQPTFTITASEYLTSTNTYINGSSTTVKLSSYTTMTTITEFTTGWLSAAGFEIRWRANDSEIIALLPNSTSNLAGSSASSNRNRHSSLSGGAIAGIVIGFIALFVLLGLVWFLWSKRKRNLAAGDLAERSGKLWKKAELDSKVVLRAELPGEKDAVEMPQPPVELPGHEVVRETAEPEGGADRVRNTA
jgi:hypothetical protein